VDWTRTCDKLRVFRRNSQVQLYEWWTKIGRVNFLPPYHFLWDDDKAGSNESRHAVSFDAAIVAFNDPLSQTCHDFDHSEHEDRWLTIGHDQSGALLVMIYTCEEHEAGGLNVRIISARRATKSERLGYETGKYFIREPDTILEDSTVSSTAKSYADMDELPPDFDFSKCEVGKFYHENAVIHFPVYLDPEVLKFFSNRAHGQHLSTEALLNQILKREMAQIRAGTGS
jgi:uncharacterized DUF497 family protein